MSEDGDVLALLGIPNPSSLLCRTKWSGRWIIPWSGHMSARPSTWFHTDSAFRLWAKQFCQLKLSQCQLCLGTWGPSETAWPKSVRNAPHALTITPTPGGLPVSLPAADTCQANTLPNVDREKIPTDGIDAYGVRHMTPYQVSTPHPLPLARTTSTHRHAQARFLERLVPYVKILFRNTWNFVPKYPKICLFALDHT